MIEWRELPLFKVITWLINDSEDDEQKLLVDHDLASAVQNAKEDWLTARSYFDSITDPDLIDYAIYTLEAAERKYMYLLKQMKEEKEYVSTQLEM